MAAQKPWVKWAVILGVIVVIGLWAGSTYNSLVSLNEQIDGQWAQVETSYQRRFDLIPQLVNTTRGFFKQEQALYDKIMQARAAYAGASGKPAEQVAAANQLESAFGRLLVIVESNPEIKSIQAVNNLMAELAGTENRVSVERRRFNESVQVYNVKVKRIPSNIIAGLFNFDAREFFQADEGAAKAPAVNLEL